MATIKDVAAKAGVSISTASRVLNSSKPVSDELQKRVHDAVLELNFSLNDMARGLKNLQTHKIAVIIPRISRSFFADVLDGIHLAAEKRGYSLWIAESYDDLNKEKQMIESFVSQWIDGIILASSVSQLEDASTKAYIKRLQSLQKKDSRIPVVTLEFALSSGLDAVLFDNSQATYDAVSYLIEKIHRKNLLFIGLPAKSYIGQERLGGFIKAMSDHGLDCTSQNILEGSYTTYSGYTVLKKVLEKESLADGIFCATDQMAIGAIKACQEFHVRIPEDIAIMGIDDIYASSIVTPSLSSICFPKEELGMSAMNRLADILGQNSKTKHVSRHISLQYELIERQTTNKNAVNILKQDE